MKLISREVALGVMTGLKWGWPFVFGEVGQLNEKQRLKPPEAAFKKKKKQKSLGHD